MTDKLNRPRRGFQPTEEQRKNVKILLALSVPQPAIRAIIRDHKDRPISDPTFRKHFRKEINTAATELQGSKRGPSIWVSSRAGPEKLQPAAAFLPAGPAR